MTAALGDEDLMRAYLSGDTAAFDALYKRHARKVYSYLLKRSGSREMAEELHQAVFLKFHQSRTHYDPKYAVLQWLFVISKTTLLDHFRKQGRQVLEVGDLSPEEIESAREPVSQDPDAPALDGLSEEHRKIVEWRYMQDETYKKIAKRLGRSEASVRQIASRALKRLREGLGAKKAARNGVKP